MLVVVAFVRRVPMSIVQVIDVIAMPDRGMTAPRAVHMVVRRVLDVAGRLAFVVVAVVFAVQVAVVRVVDVVTVLDGEMTAAFAVPMIVFGVLCVCRSHPDASFRVRTWESRTPNTLTDAHPCM